MENELNWWDKQENKEDFKLSVSIIEDNGIWVATCNEETKVFLGDRLCAVASGNSKEQAVSKMFMLIRHIHSYTEECRLNYQRFVPFRKGDWKQMGGRWFVVFGIQVYFRYGRPMMGGFFIPFTKLNVTFKSDWTTYRNYKLKKQSKD